MNLTIHQVFSLIMTIYKYPILFSIILILSIILIGKIPFETYFEITNDSKKIILNIIIILSIFLLIFSKYIPSKLSFSLNYKKSAYYFPLILYVYIFSGGFKDFFKMDFNEISNIKIYTYSLKILLSAFFEELLFRGLILGIILYKYINSNYGIVKSVFITSLIFGFTHIINIWSSEMTTQGVYNQIYATFSLGFLFAAVYLKTKNIYILIIIHSAINFFSSIENLNGITEVSNTIVNIDKTWIELIISEIIRLIIFGIPLLIGLFILKSISKQEIYSLFKYTVHNRVDVSE
ncbi:MAG: CPBP family intramembrane glutamic endopeptidase [Bacteroidota bacterium]